jgi:carboxylesterase type B
VFFTLHDRYIIGSASDFHGSDLINESNGSVIVVTIQYRLGVFGKSLQVLLSMQTAH